jgi:RimJ/RimL family protein N-acetyltransferase
MIETERLLLRRWREDDRAPFAILHRDLEVTYWLGGPAFVSRAAGAIDRYNQAIDERGFGKFALERREDGALVGAIGVMPVPADLPLGGFEIGWWLGRPAWGYGYATEAAGAALAHAFDHGLVEIVSFTAEANQRSLAVMQRIGMARDPARDFDHPAILDGDPLRRHIVCVSRGPLGQSAEGTSPGRMNSGKAQTRGGSLGPFSA